MQHRKILVTAALATAILAPLPAHAYEYDQQGTGKLMMQMIADIGGHDAVSLNSGKVLPCSHGGTKKITIAQEKGGTRYSGEYLNCNQNGSIRDGIFEIVLQGNAIETSSARRSKNGELFDATLDGDPARVRKLMSAGADVNYSESIPKTGGGTIDGWTPLMSAVAAGNAELVHLLVAGGAWVNYLNSLSVNALWIAAHNGNTEIVRYLLKSGGYVNNSNYEEMTPIMAAAMNGHLEVVKLLARAHARLDLANRQGDTALMLSLMGGHTEVARALLNAGAGVRIADAQGITALHIAAAEGNLDAVKLLMRRKPDMGARTRSGITAEGAARSRGHAAIANLLAGHGTAILQ